MSDPLLVRPVNASDRSQWRGLWLGYNEFYGRAGTTALPEAVTRSTWSRLLDAEEPLDAYVAEQDGVLVGLAHCVWHQSTTSKASSCYLQDLYTQESSRRAGVGRSLIAAVIEQARAAGASRVYWQTHESNGTARRLYDQVADHAGFIVYTHMLGQD